MSRASVLGAGPWGASVAALLARSGHSIGLWARRDERRRALLDGSPLLPGGPPLPEGVSLQGSLEEALAPELLFLAIPPAAVGPTLLKARSSLRPEHRIVHLVRGFEASGRSISQLIDEETCVAQCGALAGPIVPAEFLQGGAAAAVIGSPFQSLVDEVSVLLANPQLRLYGTLDCLGVELGGALRAPYGLAIGLARSFDASTALSSFLLVRALAEGSRLAARVGARPETLSGLSGLGDWMHMAFSSEDAVVAAGINLARTGRCSFEEAALRSRILAERARRLRVDMPIVEGVDRILGGASVREVFLDLMNRDPRPEWDV